MSILIFASVEPWMGRLHAWHYRSASAYAMITSARPLRACSASIDANGYRAKVSATFVIASGRTTSNSVCRRAKEQ